MIKVRIDKCESSESWYRDMVDSTVMVEDKEATPSFWMLFGSSDLCILKSDCTVIQDNTDKEAKDTYQPDEWVVWSGEKPVIAQIDKRNYFGNDECYSLKTNNKHNSCSIKHLRPALPHEIPAPEPLGYCIKRTPENAAVLNKWMRTKDNSSPTGKTECYVYSEIVDKAPFPYVLFEEKAEGFTELFTTEEFFAKVGYTPEFILPEKWCVKDTFKEISDYSNKNGAFKPYAWGNNLYHHYPKTNDGCTALDRIEQGYTEITKDQFMKYVFEKVPAPEYVKPLTQTVNNPNGVGVLNSEVEERIPFDLEKWNSGKYDVVTSKNYPFRLLCTNRNYEDVPIFGFATIEGEEIGCAYTLSGKGNKDHDLLLIPKTETVWMNVYHGNPHKSKDIASFESKHGSEYKVLFETIEVKRPIK